MNPHGVTRLYRLRPLAELRRPGSDCQVEARFAAARIIFATFAGCIALPVLVANTNPAPSSAGRILSSSRATLTGRTTCRVLPPLPCKVTVAVPFGERCTCCPQRRAHASEMRAPDA